MCRSKSDPRGAYQCKPNTGSMRSKSQSFDEKSKSIVAGTVFFRKDYRVMLNHEQKESLWIEAQDKNTLTGKDLNYFNDREKEYLSQRKSIDTIGGMNMYEYFSKELKKGNKVNLSGSSKSKIFYNNLYDSYVHEMFLEKTLEANPTHEQAEKILADIKFKLNAIKQQEIADKKEAGVFKEQKEKELKEKRDLYDLLTAKGDVSDKDTLDKLRSEIKALEADLALLGGIDTSTNGKDINFAVWGAFETDKYKPFTDLFLKRYDTNIKKNYLAKYIDPFEFYIQKKL